MKDRARLVVLSVCGAGIVVALYVCMMAFGYTWSGFEFMIGMIVSDLAHECFKEG